MKKRTWDDNDYVYYCSLLALAVCLAAGGIYMLFLRDHFPLSGCRFYRTLHLYCPACGGTRALRALLRGQLLRCAYYQPALLYGAVVMALYWSCQTWYRLTGRWHSFMKAWKPRWLRIGIWILLGNWLLRNLLLLVFDISM